LSAVWPHPIVDLAAAIVGVVLVALLRVVYSLQERVTRLEATLVERDREE
jgi:uncharacterized integral membrane protein